MIGESILELHETNATDESINSDEYNEYQPITGTQLNSAAQITIIIENQDQFLHLQNSYLLIEGEVLKADNTRYADADLIALTNNGLLYLFSSLKLTLAGQEMEHVNYPGHATSFLGLASYSSEYQKGCGLAQGWFAALNNNGFAVRQQFLIQPSDPKGSFQCVRRYYLYTSFPSFLIFVTCFMSGWGLVPIYCFLKSPSLELDNGILYRSPPFRISFSRSFVC